MNLKNKRKRIYENKENILRNNKVEENASQNNIIVTRVPYIPQLFDKKGTFNIETAINTNEDTLNVMLRKN